MPLRIKQLAGGIYVVLIAQFWAVSLVLGLVLTNWAFTAVTEINGIMYSGDSFTVVLIKRFVIQDCFS